MTSSPANIEASFPGAPSSASTNNPVSSLRTIQSGLEGFGYDPIFIPGEDIEGATFAQMSVGAKNMISHRAKAFRALARGVKEAQW